MSLPAYDILGLGDSHDPAYDILGLGASHDPVYDILLGLCTEQYKITTYKN